MVSVTISLSVGDEAILQAVFTLPRFPRLVDILKFAVFSCPIHLTQLQTNSKSCRTAIDKNMKTGRIKSEIKACQEVRARFRHGWDLGLSTIWAQKGRQRPGKCSLSEFSTRI